MKTEDDQRVRNRRVRLTRLINERYESQADFVAKTGENQGEISALQKENGKSFGEKKARKIEEKCSLPNGWLDIPDDSADEVRKLAASNIEAGPDFKSNREYPVISWVQAGEWTELCDNFEPGHAEDWRPCHKDLGKCGYVLRVKGKSMTAAEGESLSFPNGILLYVNPDSEVLPEKFVIVRRNATKEATFKKFTMVDGEPYLEALNPNWPNRYLKLQEGDQFCGVVMHAGFDMP